MTSHVRLVPTVVFAALTLSIVAVQTVAQSSDAADVRAKGDEAAAELADPEEATESEQQTDLEEMQRQLNILAEEVERLRSGEEQVELTPDDARAIGLAPSAAATYGRRQGVSIAGYGEMLLENFASDNESGQQIGQPSQFDFARAILYAGYRFNDKFLFNSEIEVEHADEVFVEFAYVDYLAHENFGVRGGLLLIPMGLVNEFHEPNVFLGADRPVTEQLIIPSTWRENGGGIYGSIDRVSFRAYVVNGFDGSRFAASGLRGGRQKGSKAKASSMAFTGRVDVTPTPGIFFGASLYTGGASHGEITVDDQEFGVRTTIIDVHSQIQIRGFDLRGLYARAAVADAAVLNTALQKIGTGGIAETLEGGYVQVGYNLFSQAASTGDVALTPYIRFEKVDTQAAMPIGFKRSLSTDATYTTFGVELKPFPQVVLKIDHAWVSNAANSGVNQFNLAMGYAF